MKWLYLKLSVFIVVILMSLPASAHVIRFYNINFAQTYQGKSQAQFFIQLGSFSSKSNAVRLQKTMQAKVDKKVTIARKHGNYVVEIGPLNSAAEVRKTARQAAAEQKQIYRSPPERTNAIRINQKPEVLLTSTSKRVAVKSLEKEPLSVIGNWYLSIDAGEQWNNLGQAILVKNGSDYPEPYDVDKFIIKPVHQTLVGGTLGYRKRSERLLLPAYAVGVRYRHIFSKDIGQTIIEYSMPEFTNYNYNWELRSDLVLATAKLNLFQYHLLSPYLSGGIGAAFNKVHGYKEIALPEVTPRISPAFTNHSNGQFAYSLGAGLDVQFNPRLLMSFGYEYQDLGKISSGAGLYTWAGQFLNLSSYQSNAAIFSISYLFSEQ